MKKMAISLSLLLLATLAGAHPGWGIVEDRAGNVFFTDLKQVFKVTLDGRMVVAVPNVHTHELCFDPSGGLLGEHLWYEGDATKTWARRLWRLSADGQLSDMVKSRPAFQEGDSFVRDGAGIMYWASHDKPPVIRKARVGGLISTHAIGFVETGRMTATPEGVLYLMDQGDLRRVGADGRVTTLVSKLSSLRTPPPNVRQPHYHQGLWTDRKGAVYIAVSEEAVIMRVRPGRAPEVVKSTGPLWSPSGGLIDREGRLWILEYRADNAVRVLRIEKDGRETIFDPASPTR